MVEPKLKVIVETAGFAEPGLGLYLRHEGLYSHQITVWRAEVLAHFSTRPTPKKDARDETIRQRERKIFRKDTTLAEASALLILQKNRVDLGEPTRGHNVTVEDRGQVLGLVAEAVAQGSRQYTACEMVAEGRARLHGIRCHSVKVTRWWRACHVRSFVMCVRIRSSLVWRTEENICPQSRPFTAYSVVQRQAFVQWYPVHDPGHTPCRYGHRDRSQQRAGVSCRPTHPFLAVVMRHT